MNYAVVRFEPIKIEIIDEPAAYLIARFAKFNFRAASTYSQLPYSTLLPLKADPPKTSPLFSPASFIIFVAMIRNALRHSSRAVGAVATTSKATVVSKWFLIEYASCSMAP